MRKLLIGIFFVFVILVASGNMGLRADQYPQDWEDDSTIPTRTPTSSPVEPTDPPSNPNPPPSQNDTPTPVPTNTHTPTALPPTPVGGYLATAVPCSQQATVFGLNPNFVNVRLGPGTDYEAVGQLTYAEVRPIMGRAADAAWWQIQLPDGILGWVADEVVQVNGNPTNVPIVPAPLLGDATVTPGAPWQPTPPAICPTETPTAVLPTDTPEVVEAEVQVVDPLATVTESASASEPTTPPEPEESPTATATATPITLATSASAPATDGGEGGSAGGTTGSSTLSSSGGSSGTTFDPTNLLLFGAVLMVLVGVGAVFVRQRTA